MENVNVSEIGGIAVAELVKSSFKAVSEGISGHASKLYTLIFDDFEPYMLKCYQRNRFVRILCQGDDDVDILSIYVPTFFSSSKSKFSDDEMIAEIGAGGNYIITGNGGAGKTFFMRKLWLDLFKERQRTPIFIEMRKLNELSKFDLEAFIRVSISQNITEDIFSKLCLQGRFVFILDGFDELPSERYDELQEKILAMAEKYSNCSIVISSRPDGRFVGWATFKKVEADPFVLEQTKELCLKIPFDEEFRKKFGKVLTKKFFEKHESFLSNPLLSIMMMMTFRRNMDVPTKMGIFYDEAFNTLYQWHDATKAYKRRKNLDILQFRRSFGVFCLLSYSNDKFDFSKTEIEEYIDRSRNFVNLDLPSQMILDDYERNVNLIMQDGQRYYFIHRSFQEYFAAWALVNVFPHKFSDFANKIETRGSDSVIKICYDLQRSLVVNDYISPKYDILDSSLGFGGRSLTEKVWGGYIKGVRIYFFGVYDSAKQEEDISIGFGLNIDPVFDSFFRNVLKINKGGIDDEIHFAISSKVVDHGIFNFANGWVRNIRESVKAHQEVDALIDWKEKTITLFVNEFPDEDPKFLKKIDMSSDEIAVFERSSKAISSIILREAKWCRSEISSVREVDNQIDKLFS